MVVALLAGITGPADARLYKWVDDQGTVHYSDTLPAAEAQRRRDREVKSETGLTVDVIEAPPTPAELEAKRRSERAEQRAAQARQEQERRDRILLMTYQNAREIERARDSRLSVISARITLIEQRTEALLEQREAERERVVQMERSGQGDPEPAYERIAELDRRIRENRRAIAEKQAEKVRVREDFDSDLARFRTLTGTR
jgi:hypothetical protein